MFFGLDNEPIKKKLGKKKLIESYASLILQYFPNFFSNEVDSTC